MNTNTEVLIVSLRKIFKDSNAYSKENLEEIIFHLTDWIDDLKAFVDFYENPSAYSDDKAMKIIIQFLSHAPDHLKIAADCVLDPKDK